MPRKTIHVISLRAASRSAASDLMRSIRGAIGNAREIRVEMSPAAAMIEVTLPHAPREAVMELAATLSRSHPDVRVGAHFRVNAMWFVRARSRDFPADAIPLETAHVAEVDTPLRGVLRSVEAEMAWWRDTSVHVQALEDGTQVVLPSSTADERLDQIMSWLRERGWRAVLTRDVEGWWVANGSRHHDVIRFRHGSSLPARPTVVWAE